MNGSPSTVGGTGFGAIVQRQAVDATSRTAMTAYVAGIPMTAIAMPPAAGPRIAPAWLTLLSVRDAAGRLVARHDLRLESGERRPLEAARDARHEDHGQDPEQRRARRGRERGETIAQRTRIVLVRTTIPRRSRRSATWPPKSTSDRAGIASTSPSQPRASGSRVSS